MFMIVNYPWPVASAHVELTGPQRPEASTNGRELVAEAAPQRARHLEQIVDLTDLERMRFSWYRFRLAIRHNRRASAKARAPQPKRP